MYDDSEATMDAREDERIDMMRRFVGLTEALDQEHRNAREREAKMDALSKEREQVRRKLLSVISPDSLPTEAPMRGEF